jgi:hypothetical protein
MDVQYYFPSAANVYFIHINLFYLNTGSGNNKLQNILT